MQKQSLIIELNCLNRLSKVPLTVWFAQDYLYSANGSVTMLKLNIQECAWIDFNGTFQKTPGKHILHGTCKHEFQILLWHQKLKMSE